MADAMEIEDSDGTSSDTVEYNLPTNQDNQEPPSSSEHFVTPNNQAGQLSVVLPRVITQSIPQIQPQNPSVLVPRIPAENLDENAVQGHFAEVPRVITEVIPQVPPEIESNALSVILPRLQDSQNIDPPQNTKASNTVSVEEQPSTSSRERSRSYEDEDDGATCPICLESWTNSGDHRICALKCGHLFGYNCVQRWLDSQPSNKSCPTCKKKVRRNDLRFIYAKKLVAVDNVELEAVKEQLQEALAEKCKVSQEISRYMSREHVFVQEISQLKKKIQDLSMARSIGGLPTDLRLTQRNPFSRIRLYMDKNLDVCSQNDCRDCRVFDVNAGQNLISLSTRSPVGLFGGFGLREIDLQTYKTIRFAHLHKAPIRDVCFHESNPWVLTASQDKSFKVTDIHGNGAANHSVTVGVPLWSACWDPNNEHNLFLGAQNGSVSIYDIRNTEHPTVTLTVDRDFSPVVSVAGIKGGVYSDVPQGAVLACKLNSLWTFENNIGCTYHRHSLPLEGPFMTMRYDNKSKQLLVSARPNNHQNFVRHSLCNLEKIRDPETIKCNIIHTFRSGPLAKYLVKSSCFVPGDYVAGLHEAKKSVILYSINTGDEVTSVPAHSAILDLKGFETSNGKCLAVLTEKKMEFFKFATSQT